LEIKIVIKCSLVVDSNQTEPFLLQKVYLLSYEYTVYTFQNR